MEINQEYSVKYMDLRRRKLLRKVLVLQNTFRELFLHKSERQIVQMLCQCGHHYYGHKKTSLSDDAKIMYEYLLTHNYNPYTVYKWFLWFLTSEMMKEEIENNTISQDQVRRIVTTRKRTEEVAKSWKFMEEARKTAMEMLNYV